MNRLHFALVALSMSLTPASCSDDASSNDSSGGGGSSPMGGGDACTAQIVVGLYGDDACTGEPLFTYTLDVARPCSGWSRESDTGIKTDSASRFECYRDRVCYTQYVGSETCDAAASTLITDKETRTSCLKDPTPNIWAKIESGTEGCPDAAAGFECPLSDPGDGTTGLAAACTEG
jgi:hypothetical protein